MHCSISMYLTANSLELAMSYVYNNNNHQHHHPRHLHHQVLTRLNSLTANVSSPSVPLYVSEKRPSDNFIWW